MRRGSIALVLLYAGLAHAQGFVIDGTKITFPDGSMQDTAASGASTLFSRTIVVSPEVGQPATSGQNLIDTMNLISFAGNPSANFPYLVIIEPGNYSLVDASLIIPQFVHVRGAGMDATFITSRPTGIDAVVETTGNSTIQDLTIRHRGTGSQTAGRALKANGPSIRLEDVRVLVTGDYASGATLTAVATPAGEQLTMVDCVVDIDASGVTTGFTTGIAVSESPSQFYGFGLQITVNPADAPQDAFGVFVNQSDAVVISDMRLFVRDANTNGSAGIFVNGGSTVSIRSSRIASLAEFAIAAGTTQTRVLACEVIGAVTGSQLDIRQSVDANFNNLDF